MNDFRLQLFYNLLKQIKFYSPFLLAIYFLHGCDQQIGHEYFPLQEGLHWRYKLSYETMDGPDETLFIIENLPAEMINGSKIYTRTALGGRIFHYQIQDDGLLMINHEKTSRGETKSQEYNQYVFKYPIKIGQKWQGKSRSRVLLKSGPPQITEFRIVAAVPVTYEIESLNDTVKVAAGTFKDCIRINLQGSRFFDAGNYVGNTIVSIKEKNWYAPGVGLIKSVREESTTSKALDKGKMVLELESFN